MQHTYAQTMAQALAVWSGPLETVAWKSIVILAFVAVATLLWRRGTAATRHLVWTTALLCLLCLPLFVWWVPGWRAPAWIVPTGLNRNAPATLESALENPTRPETKATSETQRPTAANVTSVSTAPTAMARAGWVGRVLARLRSSTVALWVIGIGVGLARLLAALAQLRRLADATPACENPAWLEFVDELRAEYGIRRRVRLLVCDASVTPMTWGFWRAVVALPAESVQWPDERMRLVLHHELAHVKRWDCLTQGIAHVVCVFYWFNPLAWLAARRMRSEREKACDDFVLRAGARPSEYAGHLLEIAGQFGGAPRVGAVAIVHTSGLEQRIRAILDAHRNRNGLAIMTATLVMLAIVGFGLLIGGIRLEAADGRLSEPWSLDRSKVSGQLKHFVAEKEAQASTAAKAEGKEMSPEFKAVFAAAANGDCQVVTNFFSDMKKRHPQYGGSDPSLRGAAWGPMLETIGALELFAHGDEKYLIAFGQDIIKSIPPGSIYFGGTDYGRFLVTALSPSHTNADPFFTLTQNALADGTYVSYLRSMYGNRITLPTAQDLQRCFQEYVEMVRSGRKLGEDEKVYNDANGHVSVSGAGGVMAINGLMVKSIFDKNPDREFYIEESYVLDWMRPYLEPHGLILKINRQPLSELSDEIVQRDHDYWTRYIQLMIGDWISDSTSLPQVAAFAERVYLQHDFTGFKGDPQFVRNPYSHQSFSKLRAAIANLYAWRADHAASEPEKARMTREADFAFRQALALCPNSPEAVKRYVDFLKIQKRIPEAILVVEMASRFPDLPDSKPAPYRKLAEELRQSQRTE